MAGRNVACASLRADQLPTTDAKAGSWPFEYLSRKILRPISDVGKQTNASRYVAQPGQLLGTYPAVLEFSYDKHDIWVGFGERTCIILPTALLTYIQMALTNV